MSMAPQMLLKTIPSAYWDAHPDQLDRQGQVAMSAGGIPIDLLERGYVWRTTISPQNRAGL
jgi:hypothetical protein